MISQKVLFLGKSSETIKKVQYSKGTLLQQAEVQWPSKNKEHNKQVPLRSKKATK